jgi:type II secretory pathway pseudopilin PulG
MILRPETWIPAAVAVAAIAAWLRARARANLLAAQLKSCRAALQAMRREAANAANAIRVNLLDFRQENPSPCAPEHLDEIEMGTRRVAAAVNKFSD